MKHPAYHLRVNKIAERLAFVEAIRRLDKLSEGGLSDYTYYGLGGPYLEDFRLLYEHCPEVGMVSIEDNPDTFERQKQHLPCSKVSLQLSDMSTFVTRHDFSVQKCIVWLDYVDLEYKQFGDFMALVSMVPANSMIKITLRCEPSDYWSEIDGELIRRSDNSEKFASEFDELLGNSVSRIPRSPVKFAGLLQRMVQVAVGRALPANASSFVFVPVSSFRYADGDGIFTLTGVVCHHDARRQVEELFGDWSLANLTWNPPMLIDLPVLSTKERLDLQSLLPLSPSADPAGRILRKSMGYSIHDGPDLTEAALEQYARFHRFAPYLVRGIP